MNRVEKDHKKFLSILLLVAWKLLVKLTHRSFKLLRLHCASKFWCVQIFNELSERFNYLALKSHWIIVINVIPKIERPTILKHLQCVLWLSIVEKIVLKIVCIGHALYHWVDIAGITEVIATDRLLIVITTLSVFLDDPFIRRPPFVFEHLFDIELHAVLNFFVLFNKWE